MQIQPTTIDGALIAILLAVGAIVPILFNSVILPLGKSIVTRINTGTNQKIEELEVFKLLRDEVKRLQENHVKDEEIIQKMQAQILSLQENQLTLNHIINNKDEENSKLKKQLEDCLNSK